MECLTELLLKEDDESNFFPRKDSSAFLISNDEELEACRLELRLSKMICRRMLGDVKSFTSQLEDGSYYSTLTATFIADKVKYKKSNQPSPLLIREE